MGSRLALVALSLSFFAAGCGGAADTDLYGTPPNGSGTDAGSDVTTTKDTGTDTGVGDSMPPIDAAPDVPIVPNSSIACGGAVNPPKKCDATTELCCRTGISSAYVYDCIANPADCQNSGDVPFTCSNAENCAAQGLVGNVCCASLISAGNGSIAYDVSCQPKGTCNTANSKTIVCNPNGPNLCPVNTSCKLSSQTLPGYYICF